MAICRKLLTPGRVYTETSVTSSVSMQQRPMLRQLRKEEKDYTSLLKRRREEQKEEEEKRGK